MRFDRSQNGSHTYRRLTDGTTARDYAIVLLLRLRRKETIVVTT